MAEFSGRDLHPVKKALAIAVLAINRMPGPFQSGADMSNMKGLLDQLIESDVELEHYARAARIAVTGKAFDRGRGALAGQSDQGASLNRSVAAWRASLPNLLSFDFDRTLLNCAVRAAGFGWALTACH